MTAGAGAQAAAQAAAQDGDRVARRRVFYIPGYDPFHARRYRELYRREGAEQARISGYRLALQAAGPGAWQVRFAEGPDRVEARIEVLTWSDIVAGSMGRGIAATYGQLLRTAWLYLSSGALVRLARLRKGPIIAALYPVAALILQAGLAIAAGWGLSGLLARGAAELAAGLPPGPPAAIAAWAGRTAVAAAIAVAILRWFRRHDRHLFAWYLMHDYAFTASARGAVPAALRPRLADFADRIAAALAEDWDEVLVVGHSSGVHLAIPVLAGLLRAGRVPAGGPALGFLSLGQVVPMVSFLPGAAELRADLACLATRADLTWVDVSAPGDGCAFALCDPVAVSGVAPPGRRWPLVVSAAFTRTLSPARWKALRWRFFRLHFQYLCAFDRPGDYDYFRITAGPLTLAARYRGRAPSRSRIETPLNPWAGAA